MLIFSLELITIENSNKVENLHISLSIIIWRETTKLSVLCAYILAMAIDFFFPELSGDL